jgi:signal transduction histidine kinase
MGLFQNFYHWFTKSLSYLLLSTYLLVTAIALSIVTFWAMFTIKTESMSNQRNALEVGAMHLALEIDNDLSLDSPLATRRIQQAVDRHASKLHVSITVVNKSGHVLAESNLADFNGEPNVEGQNISNKPEINEALAGIMGFAQRNAGRKKTEWLYFAYPVRSAPGETLGVIRLGVELTRMKERLNYDLIFFLQVIVATLFITGLLSIFLARRLTRPIKLMSEQSEYIADSGDITAFVPVTRSDEIGELVASFNQMIARLRLEEKKKQDFIANASHELKTPTMAIGSVVEALQAGAAEDPELRTKFLASLENLVERQSRLLRDLLDVAQLDGSTQVRWGEDVQVSDSVRVAVEQVRPQSERKKVQVTVEHSPQEFTVTGNGIQLQRAFINLLNNAVNYTPSQGQVTVLITRLDDSTVEIKIADTGSGIDPKDLPHIFDRFYRADKARSRSGAGGTGLGLAITREIINRHHGTITVDSTLGHGSAFFVRLPLKQG